MSEISASSVAARESTFKFFYPFFLCNTSFFCTSHRRCTSSCFVSRVRVLRRSSEFHMEKLLILHSRTQHRAALHAATNGHRNFNGKDSEYVAQQQKKKELKKIYPLSYCCCACVPSTLQSYDFCYCSAFSLSHSEYIFILIKCLLIFSNPFAHTHGARTRRHSMLPPTPAGGVSVFTRNISLHNPTTCIR